MTTRSMRYLAVLAVLGLLVAACGQKEGVHQGGRSVGFAPQEGEFDEDFDEDFEGDFDGDFEGDFDGDFEGDFEDGDFDDFDADGGGDGGTTGGSGTTGGTTGSGGTSGGTGGTTGGASQEPSGNGGGDGQQPSGNGGGGEQQQQQQAGDSTGITADTIKIGVHAPLSGAAPLPQASFQSGKDQYWTHVGDVFGRNVEVIVRDDQYNPSRATSVCNEMIQREEVFVLVGGGGADQIAACARVAAQQGVPYVSAGVDEGQLRQLPNYFAFSMSYVQQAPLVAQYIDRHAKPSDNRVAIVRDRTPGFNNAIGKLDQELQSKGYETQIIQYQNGPSTAQAVSGFETAFPLMAPSDFVQIVRSPGGDNPKWVGMGITMGLNTVANAACRGTGYEGMFLSPFPGLNVIDDLDPDFNRASGGGDDIELALWGLNKSMHEVFKAMGENNLHRQGFVQALENNRIETNVYPAANHSSENHFGTSTAHVLETDCANGRYITPSGGTFVDGF